MQNIYSFQKYETFIKIKHVLDNQCLQNFKELVSYKSRFFRCQNEIKLEINNKESNQSIYLEIEIHMFKNCNEI